MLLILGTKSSLFVCLIHPFCTPWSWARPGNVSKLYGLRRWHWSWTNGLCMSHWVCFRSWSFPLVLEQPTTAQLLSESFDTPRKNIEIEEIKKCWFLRWGFIQTHTCRTHYFFQIGFTFWLQSANSGSAAVICAVIRVRRLWSLKDETQQQCRKIILTLE